MWAANVKVKNIQARCRGSWVCWERRDWTYAQTSNSLGFDSNVLKNGPQSCIVILCLVVEELIFRDHFVGRCWVAAPIWVTIPFGQHSCRWVGGVILMNFGYHDVSFPTFHEEGWCGALNKNSHGSNIVCRKFYVSESFYNVWFQSIECKHVPTNFEAIQARLEQNWWSQSNKNSLVWLSRVTHPLLLLQSSSICIWNLFVHTYISLYIS